MLATWFHEFLNNEFRILINSPYHSCVELLKNSDFRIWKTYLMVSGCDSIDINFTRLITRKALNSLYHLLLAKHFLIHIVSKVSKIPKYNFSSLNHGCSRHWDAVSLLWGSLTSSLVKHISIWSLISSFGGFLVQK